MQTKKLASVLVAMLVLVFGSSGVILALYALPNFQPESTGSSQSPTLPALSISSTATSEDPIPLSTEIPPAIAESQAAKVLVPAWTQAGAAQQVAPAIPRVHVLFLDPGQSLSGRIQFPETLTGEQKGSLTLSFLQQGQVVQTAPLQPDGRFTVTGLQRGIYGVGLLSHTSMLAFSMFVGEASDLFSSGYSQIDAQKILKQQQDRSLLIESMAIHSADYPLAMQLIRQRIDQNQIAFNVVDGQKLLVPPHLEKEEIHPGTTLQHHTVRLREDGRLLGRVRKPLSFTDGAISIQPISAVMVSVLKDGQEVAQTVSDPTGEFDLTGVTPGNYSLVARSDEGFACMGIQVGPSEQSYAMETEDLQLDFCLMEGFGRLIVEEGLVEEELLEEEFCCGAAAGGCCGGGGASGVGGGGFPWGLLGLAGLLGLTGGDDDPGVPDDNPASPDKPGQTTTTNNNDDDNP